MRKKKVAALSKSRKFKTREKVGQRPISIKRQREILKFTKES